jgi:hypothetical protein
MKEGVADEFEFGDCKRVDGQNVTHDFYRYAVVFSRLAGPYYSSSSLLYVTVRISDRTVLETPQIRLGTPQILPRIHCGTLRIWTLVGHAGHVLSV